MLLEPLGILVGHAARQALDAGVALQLPGGLACTLLRQADDPQSYPIPIPALPCAWRLAAEKLGLSCHTHWADLPDRSLVMGVINVTPDSFSSHGAHFDPNAAIDAGYIMAQQGADILDIGGESTRPGAAPVSETDEWARISPVIAGLRAVGRPISVDTRNAGTMRRAVEAGARIVNDVSGLRHDPAAAATVAELGCPVILMHMRGTPCTMTQLADYEDAPLAVLRELISMITDAEIAGVAPANIAIDPGLGFAKDTKTNQEILERLPLFLGLRHRILVGASRKRFIGALTNESAPESRDAGSLAAHLFALNRGASILRTHDVRSTIQAIQVWQALHETR